jgi:hypothetical protein
LRADYREPLEGKPNPDLKIFVIVENIPDYKSDFETISESDLQKTTEKFEGLDHLLIAYQNYTVNRFSNEQIITNLNNALGQHLDQIPTWKETKYSQYLFEFILKINSGESLSDDEQTRYDYYNSIIAWKRRCRDERDLREKNLIENNILPSLIFEEIPVKTF